MVSVSLIKIIRLLAATEDKSSTLCEILDIISPEDVLS